MAQRRMFSPDIVSSDAFLDMPVSSQALYFHLSMNADDDGFVSPKRIMRLVGVNDDDLKVLLTKRFLLSFESGVVVIKHWLIHNLIRSDLYKETLYKKEKTKIGLNDNGAYTEMRVGVSELKVIEPPKWLLARRGDKRTVNVPLSALRLGKDRLGKDRKENTLSPLDTDSFELFWNKYPKKELKKKTKEIWESKKYYIYLEEILSFIEKAIKTDRWKKGYIKQPTAFLNGECWNDDLTNYNDNKNATNKPIANVLQAKQGKYDHLS